MRKTDLVSKITERVSGITRSQALNGTDAILAALKEAIGDGRRIEIRGFGVFETRTKRVGHGRNVHNGTLVPIPAGRSVRFKPGRDLRDIPAE